MLLVQRKVEVVCGAHVTSLTDDRVRLETNAITDEASPRDIDVHGLQIVGYARDSRGIQLQLGIAWRRVLAVVF